MFTSVSARCAAWQRSASHSKPPVRPEAARELPAQSLREALPSFPLGGTGPRPPLSWGLPPAQSTEQEGGCQQKPRLKTHAPPTD